jgi:DNA-binding winged helix-turn-helix (wHTH) protein/Tfp pilus assembly protein PilF/TolB-like protein
VLCFAGFELDQERARLRGPDGEAIKLRPKSFDMLQLFATNAGRVLSKQDLADAIWPKIHVGDDSLFQCIREIRTALGDEQRQLIKLVSGRGYLFEAEVTVEPGGIGAPPEVAPGAMDGDSDAIAAVTVPTTVVDAPAPVRRSGFGFSTQAVVATLIALVAVVGLAVAVPMFAPDLTFARKPPVGAGDGQKIAELAASVSDRLSVALSPATTPILAPDLAAPKPPTVAVMPVVGVGSDPQISQMAAQVTDRLTDGLAKIDKIRVLAPRPEAAAASPEAVAVRTAQADFVVSGELRMDNGAWTIQARMSNPSTGEVRWADSISVGIENADVQQIRLAAGVGHPLTLRLNAMINSNAPASGRDLPDINAKVVIEQAMASINQTTPERFQAAQAMLETALVSDPDNVDLQAALAAHLLRGLQMLWYDPANVPETERAARTMLERALRTKPTYIPVLEGYCRFLTASNQFVESLVACGKVLAFDPWDGFALYNLGLTQVQLGRFDDALATFQQAIQFDTPRVARWTWLLGAGYTRLFMDRDEEAIPWLMKSLAITPGTGRTHALLAAAYQRTGRDDQARAAMAKALELRPGSNAINMPLPKKNVSTVYQESGDRIIRAMVEAGLPER